MHTSRLLHIPLGRSREAHEALNKCDVRGRASHDGLIALELAAGHCALGPAQLGRAASTMRCEALLALTSKLSSTLADAHVLPHHVQTAWYGNPDRGAALHDHG